MKQLFLDLERQPIANAFRSPDDQSEEFFFDLQVGINPETYLVSLMNFVDKKKLFHDEYKYHASANPVMVEHFKNAADDLRSFVGLGPNDKVLEIGSNDGIFIKNFKIEQSVCVEPCGNFARLTQSQGYRTFPKFWNNDTALEVANYANGQFKLIYSANCFCHIPELIDAFKTISVALDNDGIFVFEDPSLLQTIQRGSFDQFYDEHAHIFSLTALDHYLNISGLRPIYVQPLDVHGGSNRIYAVKHSSKRLPNFRWLDALRQERQDGLLSMKTYDDFSKRCEQKRNDLVKDLWRLKKEGKRIIGYGASSKSTVVFNYCQIGTDLIDCVSDTTSAKQGLLMPGTHQLIKSREEAFAEKVDAIFLGAWNYRQAIEQQEKELIEKGMEVLCHIQ